ncbi:hypothetical protein PV11_02775 [Exophiala sideris]|uniref:Chitin-binding type-4 domain-containing protein n=1 Tax=Exophiala sideris TaxID=1016849 RepID=A0A0D1ZK81_9EURO|nr:hypothetical protein PV11_02775 [Exophiala sideris]
MPRAQSTAGALSFVLTCLPLLTSAHMQMSWPYPFRSPLDPAVSYLDADYDNTSPLLADGSDFSCKHYQYVANYTNANVVKATYYAGNTYNMTIAGTANHDGGSCQLSLSYDNGVTFKVIKSMIGGCPITTTYDFTVPDDAPTSDSAILSWSWFNIVGNREMYQNCARVQILTNPSSKYRRSIQERDTTFDDLPDMFVCNVNNNCTTIEGEDVEFPDPGDDVVNGTDDITPATGDGYTLSNSSGAASPTTASGSAIGIVVTNATTTGSSSSTGLAIPTTTAPFPIGNGTTNATITITTTASSTSSSSSSTASTTSSTTMTTSTRTSTTSSTTSTTTSTMSTTSRTSSTTSTTASTTSTTTSTTSTTSSTTSTTTSTTSTTITITTTPLPTSSVSLITEVLSTTLVFSTDGFTTTITFSTTAVFSPTSLAASTTSASMTTSTTSSRTPTTTTTSTTSTTSSTTTSSTTSITTPLTSTTSTTTTTTSSTSSSATATASATSCTPGQFICDSTSTFSQCVANSADSTTYVYMGSVAAGMQCVNGTIERQNDGPCTPNGALFCNGSNAFYMCDQGGLIDMGSVAAGTTCENGVIGYAR